LVVEELLNLRDAVKGAVLPCEREMIAPPAVLDEEADDLAGVLRRDSVSELGEPLSGDCLRVDISLKGGPEAIKRRERGLEGISAVAYDSLRVYSGDVRL